MRRLARRTPIRQACVEPGLPRVNQRSAAAALPAVSPIDPKLLARIETACGPAAECRAVVLRSRHYIRGELLARAPHQPFQFRVAERRHRRERIDPGY